MPTYEFRCPRGHDFEKFYRTISGAEAQAACPECGALAERIMSPAGFSFKGSGFYLTDYGRNAHRDKGSAPAGSAGEGSESGGGDSSRTSSEAKDETAQGDSVRRESAKGESEKGESAKGESAKRESAKGESSRSESRNAENAKGVSAKRAGNEPGAPSTRGTPSPTPAAESKAAPPTKSAGE